MNLASVTVQPPQLPGWQNEARSTRQGFQFSKPRNHGRRQRNHEVLSALLAGLAVFNWDKPFRASCFDWVASRLRPLRGTVKIDVFPLGACQLAYAGRRRQQDFDGQRVFRAN